VRPNASAGLVDAAGALAAVAALPMISSMPGPLGSVGVVALARGDGLGRY
jgi:hypothetical protein